ncbi:NADP oxidoreductase [Actinomadura rudentiformis]|uniref:NADP oxidoreductase n=2 Tax=Actinomadura rudentiformis TaxID=359158 RepID=A0A6H9YC01_9ACTN|nr:NADP oxidoreductase [Actinomadura rudentiformis]
MRIGILGAGNMAEALGGQWVRAGHEVMVGARSPEKATALAERIGARSGTLEEAAGFGEVVLLAVWYAGALDVVRQVDLAGRVLIDCTNVWGDSTFALMTGDGPSGAQLIAEASGARVVKAFNLCHESVWRMTPPAFDGHPLGVPICGDDGEAVDSVERLVRDLGCEPLPGGGLSRAGQLEATAAFVVGLYASGADPATMIPPLAHAGGEPEPLNGQGLNGQV